MIAFSQKGDFNIALKYLNKIKDITTMEMALKQYGEQGVEALRKATPKDSGKTADPRRSVQRPAEHGGKGSASYRDGAGNLCFRFPEPVSAANADNSCYLPCDPMEEQNVSDKEQYTDYRVCGHYTRVYHEWDFQCPEYDRH